MRHVAAIISLVVATTAGAQGFEGVVTYQNGKSNDTWQYMAKGDKVRFETNEGSASERGAMVWDLGAKTAMMILPSRKMYMSMDMSKTTANASDTLRGKVTKVGSEVVAGIPCDDYVGTDKNGVKQGTYCIAHGLGNFAWFSAGSPMMKRMQQRVSGFSDAVAGGGFPLKAVNAQGEIELIAIKVEKKSLDPSLFAAPAGFTQMQMPAGMMPQH